MAPSESHPVIIKVGGSLFDMPDLRQRLRRLLDDLATPYRILVPGGGGGANVVRAWDRRHGLGDEAAHWLALRSLTLSAHFLAALLPETRVVQHLGECRSAFEAGRVPIIDMHAWALLDEQRPEPLPHSWEVTSDSLALHLAIRAAAAELILLKAVALPDGTDWSTAARQGWVDCYFPQALARAAPDLLVRSIVLG